MGSQVSWSELRGAARAELPGGRMVVVEWAQETDQREKGEVLHLTFGLREGECACAEDPGEAERGRKTPGEPGAWKAGDQKVPERRKWPITWDPVERSRPKG